MSNESDWTKTQAVWDGEDWRFTEVPLEACPNWGGRTCFNRTELNYDGADPADAVDALMYWCAATKWMDDVGSKLGYSIVHSTMLEKMYEAGLIK